jgi:hypothetical protein
MSSSFGRNAAYWSIWAYVMLPSVVAIGISAVMGAWSAEPDASAWDLEGPVRERALDCKVGDLRQYDEEEGGFERSREPPGRHMLQLKPQAAGYNGRAVTRPEAG